MRYAVALLLAIVVGCRPAEGPQARIRELDPTLDHALLKPHLREAEIVEWSPSKEFVKVYGPDQDRPFGGWPSYYWISKEFVAEVLPAKRNSKDQKQ